MKHKHYDKIVAKASNMELVVLCKPLNKEDNWVEIFTKLMPAFHPETDYFLCLPQHKEACLHWLNGGEIEILDGKGFYSFACHSVNGDWYPDHAFMNTHCVFRIKPKKEKRLIVFRNNAVYGPYKKFDDINEDFKLTGQILEIEVEV